MSLKMLIYINEGEGLSIFEDNFLKLPSLPIYSIDGKHKTLYSLHVQYLIFF